ncbi:phosphatidylglycerol lysyltransferase domain-containing protein, partial [Alistipes sp.]
MIRFNPVRLADKQTIESYTLPSGIDNCDLAFANMFCWEFKYRSAWAEQEGFLLIRFQIDGGERIGYMQPVGRGDFSHLIPLLREDAHAHGQRLRIIGLTDEGVAAIRAAHPGQFAFDSDRDMEDYLYRADDLSTLTGRRYQPKRNHINRFEA